MSLIRKIIPVSLYDIPGLEHWLEGPGKPGAVPHPPRLLGRL